MNTETIIKKSIPLRSSTVERIAELAHAENRLWSNMARKILDDFVTKSFDTPRAPKVKRSIQTRQQ